MSFIDLDHNLAFVHVPKTGGTAIEGWWRSHEWHILICAAHDSAAYLAERWPDLWGPCLKVGILRNPWAWWVSIYHWYDFAAIYPSFAHFLAARDEWNGMFPLSPGQWPYLCAADGTLLVDRLLRTANLQLGFEDICRRVRINSVVLQRVRRGKHCPWQRYYETVEMLDAVAELSARDIELFHLANERPAVWTPSISY